MRKKGIDTHYLSYKKNGGQPMPQSHCGKDLLQSVPCKWCGFESDVRYKDLQDRLGSAPGKWNLRHCLSPECGLYWLDPMPTPEDLQEAYRGYYTHPQSNLNEITGFQAFIRKMRKLTARSYKQERFGYSVNINPVLRRTLSAIAKMNMLSKARLDFSAMYLEAKDSGAILDVGCGNGLFLSEMRNQGWDTYGCDVDPDAVEAGLNKGLGVRIGTLEEQEYQGNLFNAVTLSHVIEHLRDPLRTLKECFRILKPGGKLVVVTPNVRSRMHERFGCNWMALDPPRHLHLFTPQLLARIVTLAGFHRFHLFTTLRESNRSFSRSTTIRKTGRFTLTNYGPFRLRAISNLYAVWHYIQMKRDPGCGEEIAMIAEKKGNRT